MTPKYPTSGPVIARTLVNLSLNFTEGRPFTAIIIIVPIS